MRDFDIPTRRRNRGSVVLVNPSVNRLIGDKTLPMGLLYVASMLMDGYAVILIDQRVHRDWKRRLKRALADRPLCVGVTSMISKQVGDAVRVSELAKRISPGTRVVWGGIHASLLPEQTLAHPAVDAVVVSEGEVSFRELVDAYAEGSDGLGIPGTAVLDGETPVLGPDRDFMDLDRMPAVPYHLLDIESYVDLGRFGRTIRIFTSRGCPQRCAFCYNRRFNRRRWRAFSVERVLHEVRFFVERHQIEHIFFMDDNFFVDLDRALAIAEGIRLTPGRPTWSVLGAHYSDFDRMDDKRLKALELSGLKEFILGVESGSERILARIHKNIKVDRVIEANKRLARFAVHPSQSFMSGFPGETDEDMRKTVELAFRLQQDNPGAGFGTIKPFIPYPGTELFDEALGLGFKPPAALDDWKRYSWHNYMNLAIPWADAAQRRKVSNLYFYSVLMNPYYPVIRSRLYTLLVSLLRPLAARRLRAMDLRTSLLTRAMSFIQNRMV